MSLFKKKAQEFEINGETVKIRPLGLKVLFKLKDLKGPVAEAIAKLRSIGINDFEKITHSIPKPTEADPDALEMTDKTTTSAPNPAAITQALQSRRQGVEALFDCLLQDGLISEILIDSVVELQNEGVDTVMAKVDIPTAIEIFACIIKVNAGSFESLGKYWAPLKDMVGKVADKA
jgi:hypothetical protein